MAKKRNCYIKKLLVAVLLPCAFVSAYAEIKSDTVYFNKKWKITVKDSAEYYRLTSLVNEGYLVTNHYMNGKIQMTGALKKLDPEIKEGSFEYFSEKGNMTEKGSFVTNKKTGLWFTYYPDGLPWIVDQYKDGKLEGERLFNWGNGQLKREEIYSNGILVSGKCFTEEGKDTSYYEFELMPTYKGGEAKMVEFLQENVKYPRKARKAGIQGTVYVHFVVNKTGSIEDIRIIRGVDTSLDEAALEVVRKMPAWNPGKQDGVPVSVQYALPIKYKL